MGECPIAVLKQGNKPETVIMKPHGGMPYCGIEARSPVDGLPFYRGAAWGNALLRY